jgi:hypothetical protein
VTVSSAVRRSAGGRLVGRRMSGRRHTRRHVGRPLPTAQKVAKGLSEVGWEEAVDQRVGCGVERRQALDEGSHGAIRRVVWDEPEYLLTKFQLVFIKKLYGHSNTWFWYVYVMYWGRKLIKFVNDSSIFLSRF